VGTLVSSTNKIDRHDITEILLKVALKHHKPQCYVIKFKLLVVFSTNKNDCHDITEILLKVALNTIEARWGVNSCRLASISPYLPPRHL
jgi:hypothetical protein